MKVFGADSIRRSFLEARAKPERMKFLVTGSTGFVGSHLVRELEGAGHAVIAYHRPGADLSSLAGRACEKRAGELEEDGLAPAMIGCDAVFHVAGNPSMCRADRKLLWQTHVGGTQAVLAAMSKSGVARGVLTSTTSAVGWTNDPYRPADETTEHNWAPHFHYAHSKLAAERMCLDNPLGQKWVAVNPATIFGPGDHRLSVGAIFQKVLAGRFPRFRSGGFSAVDVRDVARAHLLALEKGTAGERYILTAEHLVTAEFLDRLAGLLDATPPGKAVPTGVVATLGALTSVVERLGMRPEAPANLLWCMTRYMYCSGDKAKRELGFAPRPMHETLVDSIDWYRLNGYLSA